MLVKHYRFCPSVVICVISPSLPVLYLQHWYNDHSRSFTFSLLKCDWYSVFLGLPADPLEAPCGPPDHRLKTSDIKYNVICKL